MISPLSLIVISAEMLGGELLFNEPIAYPRTPDSFFTVRTSEYLGFRLEYFEGCIGREFPFITLKRKDLKLQMGAEAAAWMTLGYKDGAFPLLTQDFLVALPISFRYRKLSGTLKFNHISAHMGDGMDRLLEETLSNREKAKLDKAQNLAEKEGLVVGLATPVVYSRDFLSGLLSYEERIGVLDARGYIHLGHIHKMRPAFLKRWFAGNGIELEYQSGYGTPYYAQDITWNQDVDSIDYSGQLGIMKKPSKEDTFELRIGLTAFMGKDRRGQLVGHKLKQLGLGLFIR